MPQIDRAKFLKAAGAASLALSAGPALAAPVRSLSSRSLSPNAQPVIPLKVAMISDLTTLSQLLSSSGFAQTLSGSGPFTLFAPTNEAFATMPDSQFNEIQKHPAKLMMLLQYLVLPSMVRLQDFATGDYTTLEGKSVDVVVVNPNSVVTVNRAHLIVPNVLASNGVIHIISKVLTKVIGQPN
jgi:uncharacterized surface protein with fasciclin (FAS1) repeats